MTQHSLDFTAYRHPVLAVPCPSCRARTGAWCTRPSGHSAADLHTARRRDAQHAWDRIWQDALKAIAAGRTDNGRPLAAEKARETARRALLALGMSWS